jgi:glyoxylase-like metal-dependent hydrolase (beta-lactamase superfamily II)/rhodanese-related sulfurtransferase
MVRPTAEIRLATKTIFVYFAAVSWQEQPGDITTENAMILQQIRSTDGTGTLSYLLGDEQVGVGCLIDPNIEDLEKIEKLVGGLNMQLTCVIDTHTHADHVSAAGELRMRAGARTVMHSNTKDKWKIVNQGDAFGIGDTLRANAAIPVDQFVEHGDVVLVGNLKLKMIFTPGHTDNHVSVLVNGNIFTGDLLLIGQAGRSDLPGGDPEAQFDSLVRYILTLDDEVRMHPGHDYENNLYSTVGVERRTNPFLQHRTKEEFVAFVKEFFPPLAENTAAGGKVTLQCGVQRVTEPSEVIRNITPLELREMLQRDPGVFLLDVREPFELASTGAIKGVRNIPVGMLRQRLPQLPADRNATIVCVCQSGGRSREAAHFLEKQGFTNVMNLSGGTGGWVRQGYPVVRSAQEVG